MGVDRVVGMPPGSGFLDRLMPDAILTSPSMLLIAATGLFLLVSVLHQLQLMSTSLMRAYTGERLVLGFRTRLFHQAQRLSVAYHDAKGTADSTFRIQCDPPHIRYLAPAAAIPLLTASLPLV